MAKGSGDVSTEELAEIKSLAEVAQNYEDSIYITGPTSNLIDMIEIKRLK